jgi:hypothetical protein
MKSRTFHFRILSESEFHPNQLDQENDQQKRKCEPYRGHLCTMQEFLKAEEPGLGSSKDCMKHWLFVSCNKFPLPDVPQQLENAGTHLHSH